MDDGGDMIDVVCKSFYIKNIKKRQPDCSGTDDAGFRLLGNGV